MTDQHCCHRMTIEAKVGNVVHYQDGSWAIKGSCGKTCCTLDEITFCPFCGKRLSLGRETPDELIEQLNGLLGRQQDDIVVTPSAQAKRIGMHNLAMGIAGERIEMGTLVMLGADGKLRAAAISSMEMLEAADAPITKATGDTTRYD